MNDMPPPPLDFQKSMQARAIRQFKAWAADPDVLVVDTETTGLEGLVWDFAALRVHSPIPLLAFLCNPPAVWTARALEMHAGRLDEVKARPRDGILMDAYGMVIESLFAGQHVLSYGGPFDHDAVDRTWRGMEGDGLILPDFGCIMTAYAPLAGQWSQSRADWKWVSLEAALKMELGKCGSGLPPHSAYGDALGAAMLIKAVAAREIE